MKILFVLGHDGLTRHLKRVFELATLNRHDVSIIICTHKRKETKRAKGLLDRIPNLQRINCVPPSKWSRNILKITRTLLDIGPYLKPSHPSPGLVTRRGRVWILRVLIRALRRRTFSSFIGNEKFRRLLRLVEQYIPVEKRMYKMLKEYQPDVVVTSPYIWPSSPDIEYLKAATRLKTPTCSVVPSWDNLSTKCTGHVPVDRLFVWNQELKTEVESLHGFAPEAITITGAPVLDPVFKWSPTLSQESFCTLANIPGDKPLLVYLCSSGSMIENEHEVVCQFGAILNSNEATKNCLLLVRPHPLQDEIWRDRTLLPANVKIYPDNGDSPDNPKSIDIYCHSIHYAGAIIGLNTTGFLEATILDRPCIALPTIAGCYDQTRFGHFRHLMNGNFLHLPSTLDDAVHIIATILNTGEDERGGARQSFVRSFIRPAGLDREASEVMLEAILEVARSPFATLSMKDFFSGRTRVHHSNEQQSA